MNAFVALVLIGCFSGALGHGRLLEPASRSSLWRLKEYASQNPPQNWNDNELFCGGFGVQYGKNGGKCGECGDPWNEPSPRANEGGGTYGRGIIARKYTPGKTIDVTVELTQSHLGYFEFRLCPQNNPNAPAGQACYDKHLLQLADGSTKFKITKPGAQTYKIGVKLPAGVTCRHCVLQWHYQTGNSWGSCEDGTEAMGCGDQEVFRGCSDISIQ